MQIHAAKLFLILAIIANLGIEADFSCQEAVGSVCDADDDCCSKNCYIEEGWQHGVCKKKMHLGPTMADDVDEDDIGGIFERGMCAFTGGKKYGADHKLTANGETYDQNQLTAGHRTLPFNTLVRVDVMGNSVIVRINNRCVGTPGQVLEMSPHAAKVMGLNPKAPIKCRLTVSSEKDICKANFGLPCRLHHECCSRHCLRDQFSEIGFCTPPE